MRVLRSTLFLDGGGANRKPLMHLVYSVMFLLIGKIVASKPTSAAASRNNTEGRHKHFDRFRRASRGYCAPALKMRFVVGVRRKQENDRGVATCVSANGALSAPRGSLTDRRARSPVSRVSHLRYVVCCNSECRKGNSSMPPRHHCSSSS